LRPAGGTARRERTKILKFMAGLEAFRRFTLLTGLRGPCFNLTMARVEIEEIIDHLSSEIRKALADAVREVVPSADFDEYALFRAFKRAVGRKCSTWEAVPKRYVEAD
jgi:hypothetical protein